VTRERKPGANGFPHVGDDLYGTAPSTRPSPSRISLKSIHTTRTDLTEAGQNFANFSASTEVDVAPFKVSDFTFALVREDHELRHRANVRLRNCQRTTDLF